ncbi:uncharacterized protein LOC119078955 [Bradysia coprophila]|uniref:uncharacterized protein LOC119078955 n=1 Tax=Bradysia coprophila TaxID=38358 RepID=UPI00187DB95E|nr:uncharacterized protein LOC119078955 [Bradysia coprophila]
MLRLKISIKFQQDIVMGVNQSIPDAPSTIYSSSFPICGTERRFCLPHNVELHIKERSTSMSGGDFKVMDANDNNIVYFRCEGRVMSSEKYLRDGAGALVLKRCSSNRIKIFADDGSAPKVCKFKSTHASLLSPAKVSTVFHNVFNGIEHELMLKCSTSNKSTAIWLCDVETRERFPLARIFKPIMRQCGNDFIMEVAANVDIAICVIMCIDLVERC